MEEQYTHTINWSKVKTLEDIKTVLKALDLVIDPRTADERLSKLLKPIEEMDTTSFTIETYEA